MALGGDGGTREQAATSQRSRDHVEIRLVGEQLQRCRALAVDDVPIVERMHQGQLPLGSDLAQALLAIREGDAILHDLCTQGAGCRDLGRIGILWYEDEGGQSDGPSSQRDSLGMVAAGHYLAAAIGLSLLERGGNAVDAGVAAGFALALMKPQSVGIGGDLRC